MSEAQVTLRTRKFIRNPLLGRRQMVVDVLHPNRPNVSKDELRQKLGELYKVAKDQVSVFGFRTQFGGGKSTGFALLYESPEAMKKFEPHYRLVRYGQASKIEKASRQQRKQRKNRSKEFRESYNQATDDGKRRRCNDLRAHFNQMSIQIVLHYHAHNRCTIDHNISAGQAVLLKTQRHLVIWKIWSALHEALNTSPRRTQECLQPLLYTVQVSCEPVPSD
nr:40s ribosomal protein s24 [Quercus suber]